MALSKAEAIAGLGEIDVSPAWLCEERITHDRAHAADLPEPAN